MQLAFKKTKIMNDTRFQIDYITAFHACWLQYHTRLWDISAIWLFVDWLTFLLFFSDRGESKQESIRGTLHYLFEGVMPFLQVNIHWDPAAFCKKIIHIFLRQWFSFIDWDCQFFYECLELWLKNCRTRNVFPVLSYRITHVKKSCH